MSFKTSWSQTTLFSTICWSDWSETDFHNRVMISMIEKTKEWCLDSQLNSWNVDISVEQSTGKELSQTYIIYSGRKPHSSWIRLHYFPPKGHILSDRKLHELLSMPALNHFVSNEFNSFQLFSYSEFWMISVLHSFHWNYKTIVVTIILVYKLETTKTMIGIIGWE